jgi:hypothetical protein
MKLAAGHELLQAENIEIPMLRKRSTATRGCRPFPAALGRTHSI